MRHKLNDIDVQVKHSGVDDLGFILELYSSYGNGEKLFHQLKTDHEIVDALIHSFKQGGVLNMDKFFTILKDMSRTNPTVKEILSGEVKEVDHVDRLQEEY